MDRQTLYVTAGTTISVHSLCLCAVSGITVGTLFGPALRYYSRPGNRQALRVMIVDTVVPELDF
jgi:hypothetical protein